MRNRECGPGFMSMQGKSSICGFCSHKCMFPSASRPLVLKTARLKVQIMDFYHGPSNPRCSPLFWCIHSSFLFPQCSKAVIVCSIIIVMASVRVMGFMNLLLLFNPVAATVGYGFIRPTPTLVGLVETQPMAPSTTRPPSVNEINVELRKRRLPDSILSAIPDSWCAFINGDSGKFEAHSSSHVRVTKQSPYAV